MIMDNITIGLTLLAAKKWHGSSSQFETWGSKGVARNEDSIETKQQLQQHDNLSSTCCKDKPKSCNFTLDSRTPPSSY